MGALGKSMHATVRAAGAVQHHTALGDPSKGFLEHILDRFSKRLALPSLVGRAVVGNRQLEPLGRVLVNAFPVQVR
jgi:hypothetical protein